MVKYVALLLGLWLSLPCCAQDLQPILMVCTGNTGRSPMAEGLANDVLGFSALGHATFSRGIHVNPQQTAREANAITVMNALGVNIAASHAQQITKADITKAHWVLTMTLAQKNHVLALDPSATAKIFTLSECATGKNDDIMDAYGHDLAVYLQTRDQIAMYLKQIKTHDFQCVALI